MNNSYDGNKTGGFDVSAAEEEISDSRVWEDKDMHCKKKMTDNRCETSPVLLYDMICFMYHKFLIFSVLYLFALLCINKSLNQKHLNVYFAQFLSTRLREKKRKKNKLQQQNNPKSQNWPVLEKEKKSLQRDLLENGKIVSLKHFPSTEVNARRPSGSALKRFRGQPGRRSSCTSREQCCGSKVLPHHGLMI